MDSRPSLGFPLGTALLMVVVIILAGIVSCCYHWDKLRRFNAAPDGGDLDPSDMDLKQKHKKQNFPVIIMPGDNVPKFIALPCPCQPPRLEKIIVEVQKPPPPTAPLY